MKKYLLVEYWEYDDKGVVQIDTLEKKHLLYLKDGMCRAIIDTENQTFFSPENNEWKKIESK